MLTMQFAPFEGKNGITIRMVSETKALRLLDFTTNQQIMAFSFFMAVKLPLVIDSN